MMISVHLFGASLPQNPHQSPQFEGFQEDVYVDPLLLRVDPTAPYMNLGDPCPCTIEYPTVNQPGWTGTCADNGGTLITDPADLDGLTCDNPFCPCDYYVEAWEQEGVFWGFPIPLNNELIALLILSLLYASWVVIKNRILLKENI